MTHFLKTLIFTLVLTAFISLKSFSQTVYVQENGKKYHMKNCSVAGTGKKGMTAAEAKKAGYTSCKVCKPDEAMTPEKPKPNELPKEGDKPKDADQPKTPAKPKTNTDDKNPKTPENPR